MSNWRCFLVLLVVALMIGASTSGGVAAKSSAEPEGMAGAVDAYQPSNNVLGLSLPASKSTLSRASVRSNGGMFYQQDENVSVNGSNDSVGPAIERIRILNDSLEGGDTLAVNVTVSDRTDIQRVELRLYTSDGASISLSLGEFGGEPRENGTYTMTTQLEDEIVAGTYELSGASTWDSLDNRRNFYDFSEIAVGDPSVEVDGTSDTVGPAIERIKLLNDSLEGGDVLAMNATLSDSTDIQRVELRFKNSDGALISLSLGEFSGDPRENGTYTITTQLDDEIVAGTYELSGASTWDSLDNRRNFYDFSDIIVGDSQISTNQAPSIEFGENATISEGSVLERALSIDDEDSSQWVVNIEVSPAENETFTTKNTTVTFQQRFVEDGEYSIAATVCDEEDACGTDEFEVRVENIPPNVSASGDTITEGQKATVTAEFIDSGTEDTHNATINWGDGTIDRVPITGEAANGSLTVNHAYGDDGNYPVKVNITDDDGATGKDTVTVAVNNEAPNVTINTSGTITLPSGEQASIGSSTQEQTYRADVIDAGSDDIRFEWSNNQTTTYFNNGESPDPALSPGGTFPFGASDTVGMSFSSSGVEAVQVTVQDDDGAMGSDEIVVIVGGDASDVRGMGYWRHQFSKKGNSHHSDAELNSFLEIVTVASGVFSEQTRLDSFEDTEQTLSPRGPDMRKKAEAQSAAAWLNFASGSVGWTEQIDTDGDGVGDRPFHEVISEIESTLQDDDATKQELERAKKLAELINHQGESADRGNAGTKEGNNEKGNKN